MEQVIEMRYNGGRPIINNTNPLNITETTQVDKPNNSVLWIVLGIVFLVILFIYIDKRNRQTILDFDYKENENTN